jgi:alpha,alpha-trehalase
MRFFPFFIVWVVLVMNACKPDSASKSPVSPSPSVATLPPAEKNPPGKIVLSPDSTLQSLFDAVQMARVFPDSKTFADCTPKKAPAELVQLYESQKNAAGFDLKKFVQEHFDMPVNTGAAFKSDLKQPVAAHIEKLWPVLTRQPDAPVPYSSLLPLPHPYIVPGGRFREVYYWDSYFTMLGLQASGRTQAIRDILDNFAFLTDTFGHIPNGNRSYYLSRSQPPFFALMVTLLSEGNEMTRFLPQLEKEYRFWMDGSDQISEQNPAVRRVVRMPDGELLNRYYDDRPAPRPEAYREDTETAQKASGRPARTVFLNLKAGAESGWDFSSRWLQGSDLTTIRTTDIVPVDLNCLLWNTEQLISDFYLRKDDVEKAKMYGDRALRRARAIQKYCWDNTAGWYMDYDLPNKKATGVMSLAGMYPLFFRISNRPQAIACSRTLEKTFLRPGGLVCTPVKTGQQWDAPNGWAPLQWISIAGLRNYEQTELANTIKKRWCDLNTRVYQRTGKLLEKYNVEDLSLTAGGGEYPVQDGFGWTNGVLLKLLNEK